MKNKFKNWIYLFSLFVLLTFSIAGCKRKTLPELSTSEASNITSKSATIAGKLNSDGFTSIKEVGICWSKNATPTISDEKIGLEFNGASDYSCTLTNLEINTTYHARAYAINTKGVGYGGEITFRTPNLLAGDKLQGGVIGYVFEPGDLGYVANEHHGLIIDASNSGPRMEWANYYLIVGTTETALGKGNNNTIKILNTYGGNAAAAKYCADYVANGYSDWYLPSLDELKKIHLNKGKLTFILNREYWSSSEGTDNYRAAYISRPFSDGYSFEDYKNKGFYVLPFRSF